MKVKTKTENGCMEVTVSGEINTITTPLLAQELGELQGVSSLVFDMTQVEYVSSAGLRLFLYCQRIINASGGEMKIRGCNEFVLETFESVGYNRIMKLEAV